MPFLYHKRKGKKRNPQIVNRRADEKNVRTVEDFSQLHSCQLSRRRTHCPRKHADVDAKSSPLRRVFVAPSLTPSQWDGPCAALHVHFRNCLQRCSVRLGPPLVNLPFLWLGCWISLDEVCGVHRYLLAGLIGRLRGISVDCEVCWHQLWREPCHEDLRGQSLHHRRPRRRMSRRKRLCEGPEHRSMARR